VLAAALVVAHREAMSSGLSALPFHKMSGSGNDFVVFDPTAGAFQEIENAGIIKALCARGTGIGADGVVFLEPSGNNSVRMRYYNADGSRASLCGNASLCSTRLALELGMVSSAEFTLETDAGRLRARISAGLPEIDLEPVVDVAPDAEGIVKERSEERLGFALVGVPHVVVRVPDLEGIDLPGRGSTLRRHPSLADGANANFVARQDGLWSYRTYERGVEGETLACGSGAVAIAIMLASWGEAGDETVLRTRSGRRLTVKLRRDGPKWLPSLRGEGRIVFKGTIGEIG
jgi:diaminopimelate epimerase